MKKIFTLCISLLMGCAALNAQTFVFVDGGGQVIENGSTLTMTEAEFAYDGYGSAYQVPIVEGFSVKNTSEAAGTFDIRFHVVALPDGSTYMACPLFQTCLPATDDTSFTRNLPAGGLDDFSGVEWLIGTGTLNMETYQYGPPILNEIFGTCTLEISVGPTGFTTPDSRITVNFVHTNPAGISGVETEKDNAVVGYYTIDGVKLNAPQKGLNIVKRADGTTTKVLVK